MTHLIVRYGLDGKTGQPRATVQKGKLPVRTLRQVEAEIHRRYNRLVDMDNKKVQFRTPIANSSISRLIFRVRVDREFRRCPTIWFTACASAAADIRPTTPKEAKVSKAANDHDWIQGFWQHVDEVLAGACLLDMNAQEILLPIIHNCSELRKCSPTELVLTLLASHFESCDEQHCTEDGQKSADVPDASVYLRRLAALTR